MSNKINNLYEFGEFRLDTQERVLLSKNETIILASKVFDTLEFLVKHQGKIVSKNVIMSEVWADSFVEEGNLTQNIYLLRKTLGKDCIETIPRRGYRFTVPVEIKDIATENAFSSNSESDLIISTKTKTHIIEEVKTDFENSDKSISLTKTQKTNLLTSKSLFGTATFAILVFTLGFVGYKYTQNESKNNNSQKVFSNIEFERLTDTGNIYSPVISPNGKFMAYIKKEAGEQTLHLKDVKSGNAVQLQIENDVIPQFIQFSPTSEKIYFRTPGRLEASNKIYEISYFGGDAKLIAENVWGLFSVSPDGKHLAFYRGNPKENKQFVVTKNIENGREITFAERIAPNELFLSVSPAWSANNKKIAIVPVREKSNRTEIIFIDLNTAKEEIIKTKLTYIRQIAFLPNEENLLIIARKKNFQIFNFNYTDGKTSKITNDLNNYRNISITADGTEIVTQQRKLKSNIWYIPEADINQAKPLTTGGYHGIYDLQHTKSGDVIYDTKGKISRDLQLINPENLTKQTLSQEDNTINNHTPTSDKKGRIYFVSDQSGSLNIWRINSDGRNSKQITFGKKGEINIAPTISYDNEWLYFIQKISDSNFICRISLLKEDKTVEKIYDKNDFSFGRFLSISPNNKWLAFHFLNPKSENDIPSQSDTQKPNFGFLNLAKNEKIKTISVPTNRAVIRWTNSGKSFDYYQTKQNQGKLWRQDFENNFAPPKLIFQTPQSRIMHFDWSPNEKDLVITRATNLSDAVIIRFTN